MAVQTLSLQIADNAAQAAANIDHLTQSLQRLQNALSAGGVRQLANQLNQLANQTGFTAQMNRITRAIGQTNAILTRMNANLNRALAGLGALGGQGGGGGGGRGGRGGGGNGFGPAGQAATAFGQQIQNVNGRLATFIQNIRNAGGNVLTGFGNAMHGLQGVFRGVTDRLGHFVHMVGRLVVMRTLRYIIRLIATSFREGLENVRAYSEAIKGLFSRDMAGLDNATLKLRNSLGAALAPAIQALLPIIHQFISYIIDAANAFNQFMSIINGRTQWTKAIDVVASDFEDVKKNASGAAKAAKNLLASWDELNIIQSKAGDGSGGSGKKKDIDYTKMFTEVYEFDNGVVRFVNYLKENIPVVTGLVAGLAAWLIGMPGWTIAAIVGVTAVFANAVEIGENGLTRENLGKALEASLIAGLGGLFIGWHFGGLGGGLLGFVLGFSVAAVIQLFAAFNHALETNDPKKAIETGLGLAAVTTLAGTALAWMAGWPLTVGAIAGLSVGAALTLYAAYANAIAENKPEAALFGAGLLVPVALAGVAAGTHFGHPVVGAILGVSVGAAIMLYANYTRALEENSPDAALLASGVILTLAAAGFATGSVFGHPVVGAVTGLLVGAVVTLITNFRVDNAHVSDQIELTEEQLQAYVEKHMFTAKATAAIELANVTVENLNRAKLALGASLASVSVAYNVIQLGLATEETYNNLYNSIFDENDGLISRLNATIKAEKKAVEVAFTLVPFTNGSEYLTSTIGGWTEVEQFVAGKGRQLEGLMSGGFTEALESDKRDIIETLLSTITEISQIISEAEVTLTAEQTLWTNIRSGDMSVPEAFAQYYRDLESGLYGSALAGISSMETLARVYTKMADAESDETVAAQYREKARQQSDLARQAREELEKGTGIAGKMKEYSQPGIEMLRGDVERSEVYGLVRATLPTALQTRAFNVSPYGGMTESISNRDYLIRYAIDQLYGEGAFDAFKEAKIDATLLLPQELLDIINRIAPSTSTGAVVVENMVVEDVEEAPNVPTPSDNRGLVVAADVDDGNGIVRRRGNTYSVVGGTPTTEADRVEEVNLLRQQNDILRQLLNKQWIAQVNPSSALGRAFQESVNMWNSASGNTRTDTNR